MRREKTFNLEEIGEWSAVKHDIVKRYATEFLRIMGRQNWLNECHYIDAFSGAGRHIRKDTQKEVVGSPLKILGLEKAFDRYLFIEQDKAKASYLRETCEQDFAGRNHLVSIEQGDCNEILPLELRRLRKNDRALCFLDPYGLELEWKVIRALGQSKRVDTILLFPIMGINRGALWRKGIPDNAATKKLTKFYGDESWKTAGYKDTPLFKGQGIKEKVTPEEFVDSFRKRLEDVAGFECVSKPCPMKNEKQGTIYYLLFGSKKPVAKKIMDYIFEKYGRM